jgi:O-acetyl-ADP-ribose deacetylase (regulator of RNase III)
MDRAVHAPAAQQARVGGVDDGVQRQPGDVALDNLDPRTGRRRDGRGGASNEDALLASCYRRSLEVAAQNGVGALAFPAISTGVYHFPPERAARIATGTVLDVLAREPRIEKVVFCCFDAASKARHEAALEEARSHG